MARTYEPGEKDHTQENFPVASLLIRKEHRPAILTFYRFARAADNVADHPGLSEMEKLSRLNAFEATLLGMSDGVAEALALRRIMAECHLSSSHALDLLAAFRQDARQPRYHDWDALMRYCALSAAPVGRFVLEVHGENPAVYPASDALCAALQVINHLQDCRADYLRLNRIYIPQEALLRHGAAESALAASRASPGLRACLMEMVHETNGLLMQEPLSMQVEDNRLALEVAVIERLAEQLLRLLQSRDPLSEPVHLHKLRVIPVMAEAICLHMQRRFLRKQLRRN